MTKRGEMFRPPFNTRLLIGNKERIKERKEESSLYDSKWFVGLHMPITKTCLFKYIEIFTTKKGKFLDKKLCFFFFFFFFFFLISAQK